MSVLKLNFLTKTNRVEQLSIPNIFAAVPGKNGCRQVAKWPINTKQLCKCFFGIIRVGFYGFPGFFFGKVMITQTGNIHYSLQRLPEFVSSPGFAPAHHKIGQARHSVWLSVNTILPLSAFNFAIVKLVHQYHYPVHKIA